MQKGYLVGSMMLVAGCVPFAGPAVAAGSLLASSGIQSSLSQVRYDTSRPLIVLGHDAQGRRVANVYQPHSNQPSSVVYFDKPPAGLSTIRANTRPASAPDLAQRGSYKGAINREAFRAHVLAASSIHGVDPALIRAVMHAESAFNPNAVSKAGAAGLMQLMPATAERMGVRNRFDPVQNVYGGTRYLRVLMDLFDGDLTKVVAAYNAGEKAVLRHGGIPPYSETQAYVPRVLSLYRQYQANPQS